VLTTTSRIHCGGEAASTVNANNSSNAATRTVFGTVMPIEFEELKKN
jgi:hypothetical protein